MDSTVSPRLVTSFLALLFCLVASLRAGDPKPPAKTITEVVAVSMVSPRAAAPLSKADPNVAVMHLAASGGDAGTVDPIGPMSADRWQPLKVPPVTPVERPAAVDRDRASPPAPQAGKAAARTSTTSPQVARAAPAAKPPSAVRKARPKRTPQAPVLAQARPPAPEVPSLFEPLRKLGLSIQAKLPATPARVAPAPKPAEPGGPTPV